MKRPLRERFFPLCRPFSHRLSRWRDGGTKLQFFSRCRRKKLTQMVYRFDCTANPEVTGRKILFIADLHWNDSGKNRQILAGIESAIADIRPDYLIFGGDQCGDADTLETLKPVLRSLAARVPCALAVNGNWECGKEWLPAGFWKDFFSSCGIRHLCNEFFADQYFLFAGVDDVSSGNCELPALPAAERDKFRILLAHSPDTVIALDSAKGDMVGYSIAMCGHTHGGQVRFFGPVRPRSRYGRHFDIGLMHHIGANEVQMLISAGVGELSFPWRINCRREITVVEFFPSGGAE